jgi:hypothetical protein
MPNRRKKEILVNYKNDGTVDAEIHLNDLNPKRGRGYRSVVYFEGTVKAAGMAGYIKLWRPVSKKKRNEIMQQFYKNKVACNSPKII